MPTLFYNGRIRTGDVNQPIVAAFLVEDGYVRAIGKTEDFNLSGINLVNLEGKTVLPGFNDAHIHLWKVGQLDSFILDLRGIKSIEAIKEKISQSISAKPKGTWIIGRGFNESVLVDGRMPELNDLDPVSPEHPVFLIRTCAHIAVVNSLAEQLCGITEETTIPEGGKIGRSNGKTNGQLFENALGLVNRHLPRTTREEYCSMIEKGAKKMLAAGITSITDPAVHPELMEAYHKIAGPGLGLRLNLMPMMMPDGGHKTYPLPPTETGHWKRITTAKLFADGGLSGATAALTKNYRGNRGNGILRISTEQLLHLVSTARAAGFNLGIHAIGDRAISQVLEVYEQTNRQFGASRNRIEHFGLPTDQDLDRAAMLGVIAIPQTIFINELGENFIQVLEADDLQRCYPIQTLIKKNIPFAMSTDAPVVKNFNPWKNIQTAITRRTAGGDVIAWEEAISLEEAISAYTVGSAYAEGTESFKGTLTAGMLADFIVLDRDPYETPTEALPEIQTLATYTSGEEVFTKTI